MLSKALHSASFITILCIGALCINTQAEEVKTTDQPQIKKRPSLQERSALLASGNNWAMVPKTSVIYIPQRYTNKIVTKPKGKLLDWSAFFKKNSGWIHTHEVTLPQARGQASIDSKVIQAYQSMGKVVIATYKKNPITVKPEALTPSEQ